MKLIENWDTAPAREEVPGRLKDPFVQDHPPTIKAEAHDLYVDAAAFSRTEPWSVSRTP